MLTLERRDSFDTYTLEQPQIPKNNFDLLRLLLALNVCLCHLGEVNWVKTYFPLSRIFNSTLAVDCFCVISGFHIFRSFERPFLHKNSHDREATEHQ